MIREFRKEDLNEIMKLWLETNQSAHSFIDRSFWEDHYESVKQMLPQATIYVYEKDQTIMAFTGLMDHYIAGIFVSEKIQSQGVGKKMLNHCKQFNEELMLNVYQKNERAVRFYLREGFRVEKEQMDKDTGEIEYQMRWIQK